MLRDLHVDEESTFQAYKDFLLEVNGLAESIAGDGIISLAHFFSVVANRPSLMEPLFTLQKKLRGGIIGEEFWKERETVRRQILGVTLIDTKSLEETSNLKEHDPNSKKRRNSNISIGFVDLGVMSLPHLDLSSTRMRRNSNSSGYMSGGRPSSAGSRSSGRSSSREILERPGSPPKCPTSSRSTIFSSLCSNKNRASKANLAQEKYTASDSAEMDIDDKSVSIPSAFSFLNVDVGGSLSARFSEKKQGSSSNKQGSSPKLVKPGVKRKSLLRPSRFSRLSPTSGFSDKNK